MNLSCGKARTGQDRRLMRTKALVNSDERKKRLKTRNFLVKKKKPNKIIDLNQTKNKYVIFI